MVRRFQALEKIQNLVNLCKGGIQLVTFALLSWDWARASRSGPSFVGAAARGWGGGGGGGVGGGLWVVWVEMGEVSQGELGEGVGVSGWLEL